MTQVPHQLTQGNHQMDAINTVIGDQKALDLTAKSATYASYILASGLAAVSIFV